MSFPVGCLVRCNWHIKAANRLIRISSLYPTRVERTMLALTLLFLAVAAQALPAPSKTVGINSFTLPHLDYSAVKASGVSLGAFSKSTGDSSPRTSTDSCNEQQYEAFIERTDQCISQAKSVSDLSNYAENLLKFVVFVNSHSIPSASKIWKTSFVRQ